MKNKNLWEDIFRPIVVLGCICLVCSLLLGVTNQLTSPVIKANQDKAANEAYYAVLPTAEGFEELTSTQAGVTKVLKAQNGVGYVISAEAQGYGGMVPVVVAFGEDGNIACVTFPENSETAGLGQKIRDESFASQFAGKASDTMTIGDIDAIPSATISSVAAVNAVNNAIAAYKEVA